MKFCYYCGYKNKYPRVPNARRCPRCGNPYGHKPTRRLYGRWTKG